jgi:endonuclease YncB( thermonuclease family)
MVPWPPCQAMDPNPTPRRRSAWPVRGRRAAALSLVIAIAVVMTECVGPRRHGADPAAVPEPARRDHRSVGRLPAGDVVAVGAVFEARVTRVRDGDSLDATLPDGRTLGVRIAGIDAPERSQPFADAARRHLASIAAGRRIRAEVTAIDHYERAVARVALPAPVPRDAATDGDAPEPTDLGLRQIRAGLAWFYRRYADDLPGSWAQRYDDAERTARQDRTGLWLDRAPLPPWHYREASRPR